MLSAIPREANCMCSEAKINLPRRERLFKRKLSVRLRTLEVLLERGIHSLVQGPPATEKNGEYKSGELQSN